MHSITLVKVIKEGKSYNVTLGSCFTLSQLYWFAATLFFCINFILFAATFLFTACPLWAPVVIWFSTLQNSDSWLSFKCSVLHLHYWPRLFQKGNNTPLYTVDNIVYPVDNTISFPYTYPLDNDLLSR